MSTGERTTQTAKRVSASRGFDRLARPHQMPLRHPAVDGSGAFTNTWQPEPRGPRRVEADAARSKHSRHDSDPITKPITAAICTRNRGAAAVTAARSVLANESPHLRLVIVDQSTSHETERALAEVRSDARVTYVRLSSVGVSRGRNEALRLASTEIVAFTDDDCEVVEGWLPTVQGIFDEHPRAAVAFCSVRAGPFDAQAGFIPVYECRGTRIIDNLIDKCTARGIGAGLAVRRRVVLDELRGFDEALGAGGRFPAAEDGDIATRALLAGYEVCETDQTYVIHHGFRTWAQGRELGRRDWRGIGAACAKPLRAGRWDFVPVALYELVVCAVWPPIGDLARLRRPRGVSRGISFLGGLAGGLWTPLNRKHVVFEPDAP